MRSGLSLRIPGNQELSPSRSVIKSASQSLSFIKPGSPKPSEGKNHHRTPTHSSPYSRITSSMSMKKLSLPSFLRISSNNLEILHKLPLGKSTISQASECPTDTSSIKTSNENSNSHKPQVAQTPEEFMKKIFKNPGQKEEILLKVGKIELTRDELQSLQPKSQISRNVIDACLRCIKHKNRKFFKNAESHDRVLIINTNFSEHIFTLNKEMRMHCQRNPLKYEYVLFPIFVGFWTLLALNNREKKLEIYNIPEKDLMVEEIFAKVVEFVKRELRHHEKKEIEVTGWRELSYEIIQFGLIDKVDSAAFAIRIAYKIAINNKAQVTHEIMHDFRYNLIVMLYKHGNQV